MKSDYSVKWQQEIDLYRQFNTTIILEGNIVDDQVYYQDGNAAFVSMEQYLRLYLESLGYEHIVFFDQHNGFRCFDDEDVLRTDGEKINSFKKLVEKSETAHGRECSWHLYANHDYGVSCFNTAIPVIQNAMQNEEAPVAIIMQEASRYVERPDNVGTEYDSYSFLRMVTRSQQFLACPSNPQKRLSNIMIMLADKVNDIPAWFYLNNPLVRTVSVPLPDRKIRRIYIEAKCDEEYLPNGFYELEETEREKLREKYFDAFIEETDGFRINEMDALLRIMTSEGLDLSRISTAATLFKHGTDKNPWEYGDLVEKLSEIEEKLAERVKGQEAAIQKAAGVLRSAVLGLSGLQHSRKKCRPKGILFLAGPTGVGKTELAKAISAFVFGTEDHVVRFDMSEYKEVHTSSRLLGAPPGYVGYEQGGQLTEAIKRDPFSVLLFDEIEKADSSILDKFLQILEDGRLTDGKGETVYFSNALIIFTSNLGIIKKVYDSQNHTWKNTQVVQYGEDGCNEENGAVAKEKFNEYSRKILTGIDDYFIQIGRPELKNRIGDNFVVFNFISMKAVEEIAKNKLEEICTQYLADKDIDIEVKESFYTQLYTIIKSEDELKNGGRGVGNKLQSCFVDPLGDYIVRKGITKGGSITVRGFEKTKGSFRLICDD